MAKYTRAPQMISDRLLPDPLPSEPMTLLASWLEEAASKKVQPNPDAIALATVDDRGRPDTRIVLCKDIDPEGASFVFFTNRESTKGRHLAHTPYASIVFFWDTLNLQARARGPVTLASEEESEAYFRTRWVISRVSAHASDQSRPIGSREEMVRKVEALATKLGVPPDGSKEADVPRPPQWGGYRLWAEEIELWIGQPGRVHDRARWSRTLTAIGDERHEGGPWTATRLQP